MVVESGAVAKVTLVASGGIDVVLSGGTAVAGGTDLHRRHDERCSAGAASRAVAGARLWRHSGVCLGPSSPPISGGLIFEVLAGGVVSGVTFGSVADKRLLIFSGGVASDMTIGSGGIAKVFAGGTDNSAAILKGGSGIVSSGGVDLGVVMNSGGTEIVSAGGIASDTAVSSGGVQIVASGGDRRSDGHLQRRHRDRERPRHRSWRANLRRHANRLRRRERRDRVQRRAARSGGGTASDTFVSGGSAIVCAGGTAIDMTIDSGATALILSAGFGAVQSGGTFADSGSLINSGTINILAGGTLALDARIVSNNGTINLQGADGGAGATLLLDPDGGAGRALRWRQDRLSSSGNNFFGVGTTVTLTNIDNTIAGAGSIGDGNAPLILINGGTINANTGNALTIACARTDRQFGDHGGDLERRTVHQQQQRVRQYRRQNRGDR